MHKAQEFIIELGLGNQRGHDNDINCILISIVNIIAISIYQRSIPKNKILDCSIIHRGPAGNIRRADQLQRKRNFIATDLRLFLGTFIVCMSSFHRLRLLRRLFQLFHRHIRFLAIFIRASLHIMHIIFCFNGHSLSCHLIIGHLRRQHDFSRLGFELLTFICLFTIFRSLTPIDFGYLKIYIIGRILRKGQIVNSLFGRRHLIFKSILFFRNSHFSLALCILRARLHGLNRLRLDALCFIGDRHYRLYLFLQRCLLSSGWNYQFFPAEAKSVDILERDPVRTGLILHIPGGLGDNLLPPFIRKVYPIDHHSIFIRIVHILRDAVTLQISDQASLIQERLRLTGTQIRERFIVKIGHIESPESILLIHCDREESRVLFILIQLI